MKRVRRKLQALEADRDALAATVAGLLEANNDLAVMNRLQGSIIAHLLAGREDEAWSMLGEFYNTPKGGNS
jgi:hypothetical protein